MPTITESYWRERIKIVKCNNETYGAVKILEMLRSAEHESEREYAGPSEATIGRILKNEWFQLNDEEKDNYRYVYWPESMEDGYLPWHMSRNTMELLKFNRIEESEHDVVKDIHKSNYMNWRRPSVNDVKWFWRVSESLPNNPGSEEYDELNVKARWLVAKFLHMRSIGFLDSHGSSNFEIARFLEEAMIKGMDRDTLDALKEFMG